MANNIDNIIISRGPQSWNYYVVNIVGHDYAAIIEDLPCCGTLNLEVA